MIQAAARHSGLIVDDKLIGYVRHAFDWNAEVAISVGPRGALGQIWRLDVGPARYALKEIFAEPPSGALMAAELEFARRAVSAGVRLPASHPDRDGNYLLTAPDGTRLRLYDWVDLRPVDLSAERVKASVTANAEAVLKERSCLCRAASSHGNLCEIADE